MREAKKQEDNEMMIKEERKIKQSNNRQNQR